MGKRMLGIGFLSLCLLNGSCIRAVNDILSRGYHVAVRTATPKRLENIKAYFDGKLFWMINGMQLSPGGGQGMGPVVYYNFPRTVRFEWDSSPKFYPFPDDWTHHSYTLEVKKHLPRGWRKCCDEIIFIFNKDDTVSLGFTITHERGDGTADYIEYDANGNVVNRY